MTDFKNRLAATCAAMSVCATLGWAPGAHAQGRFSVDWAKDRLSVHALDAPLSDVVAEVARRTGLRVVGEDKLQGPVTVDFAELPAVDGLKALLTDVNYFMQQQPEGDIARIGLVLHVHSMARRPAPAPISTDPILHVPALDALIEAENEEIEEAKEEEAEDPDVEQENRENMHAARQLVENGVIGNAATTATLERYLHNDNDQIRLEAVKALAQRPLTTSIEFLVEAMGDDSIEVRRYAIAALARDRGPESLLTVGLALEKDLDPLVRQGALRVLALRVDAAATVHLRNVLATDQEPTVREAAQQMLDEFARLARLKKEKQPARQ